MVLDRLGDGVGFRADNVKVLREAFHEAVEDSAETCATIGKMPQKPNWGRMMFRVNPKVHRNASLPCSHGSTLPQGPGDPECTRIR